MGTGTRASSGDGGPASSATIGAACGIWQDSLGVTYVADGQFSHVRSISTSGIIGTFVGNGSASSFGNGGAATSASFIYPTGVAQVQVITFDVSTNTLVLSDYASSVVRIVPSSQIISTAIGTTLQLKFNGDGIAGTSANLAGIYGVASMNGVILVGDSGNSRIRSLVSNMLYTIAGCDVSGNSGNGGMATSAHLNTPYGIFIDTTGNVLFTDNQQAVVRKLISLTPTSRPTTIAPSLAPMISNMPSCVPTPIPSLPPSGPPSAAPSVIPSVIPTLLPTVVPTVFPSTMIPSFAPTLLPTALPSVIPSTSPSMEPSYYPTLLPTVNPSVIPSVVPTVGPSCAPSMLPSLNPSVVPSRLPSLLPTVVPSNGPTVNPSLYPSVTPSVVPTVGPSASPSLLPSVIPSLIPSIKPSLKPTVTPSVHPSEEPTAYPSEIPSVTPTMKPSSNPSVHPSVVPSTRPSCDPTLLPSVIPSVAPSIAPTAEPSSRPTVLPSEGPSVVVISSLSPSESPVSTMPSALPTMRPSLLPSINPSLAPSADPTALPSLMPSILPRILPTLIPTLHPSISPTPIPSLVPSRTPSLYPSVLPSFGPTLSPTLISESPSLTRYPTSPTPRPTMIPSVRPSLKPTRSPTLPPSLKPTNVPSVKPSALPSVGPSVVPSQPRPTISPLPTELPSVSVSPSELPTVVPSAMPTAPLPSQSPSVSPSCEPSGSPTPVPTLLPTTLSPSVVPSSLEYYAAHPKATLPSNQSISVIGPSDLTFKIVMPFLSLSSGPFGAVFDDITLISGEALSVSYVLRGTANLSAVVTVDQADKFGQTIAPDSSKRSVSVLRDVNGDGLNDLIIGDGYSSKCYVMFGTEDGRTNMTRGFTIFGESEGDLTGWSVSGAGDVNNDTLADIIVGAPFARGVGAVYVIYGRRFNIFDVYLSNLTALQGFVMYGDQKSDYLGVSVSDAGDVNGDGCADVIFGGVMTSLYFAGAAYVVYGGKELKTVTSLSQLTSEQGYKLTGASYGYYGYSVSGAGDVNRDGLDDVLIGSSPQRPPLVTYLVYGSRALTAGGSLSSCHGVRITGGGLTVSYVGDINHDGYDDIMIGGSLGSTSGVTGYIVYSNVTRMTRLTSQPSVLPSALPVFVPTKSPTRIPSRVPLMPTIGPTRIPSVIPSFNPTAPTDAPTPGVSQPSSWPSSLPSYPTIPPSAEPSEIPSVPPSVEPSESPTCHPTETLSELPSVPPSGEPSNGPTLNPTESPSTLMPIKTTHGQVARPTVHPTVLSSIPSLNTIEIESEVVIDNQSEDHQNYLVNTSEPVSIYNLMGTQFYDSPVLS